MALYAWFGSTGEMTKAGCVQLLMLLKIASLRIESVIGGGLGCRISYKLGSIRIRPPFKAGAPSISLSLSRQLCLT